MPKSKICPKVKPIWTWQWIFWLITLIIKEIVMKCEGLKKKFCMSCSFYLFQVSFSYTARHWLVAQRSKRYSKVKRRSESEAMDPANLNIAIVMISRVTITKIKATRIVRSSKLYTGLFFLWAVLCVEDNERRSPFRFSWVFEKTDECSKNARVIRTW